MLSRLLDRLGERRAHFALAAASGVLYFVGFCGFDQFYLAWVCLVPVLWALDDESLNGWEALGIAWLFGLVTHLGGYTWLTGMLRDFGHLPLPLALLGYFLLCLAQSTLLAFWGWAVNRLRTKLAVSPVWSAPVLMVIAEWAWPALFPSYLANSQYRQLLFIQSLDVWGPLGLTFILTLASSVVYQLLAWRLRSGRRFPKAALPAVLLLVTGNILYGIGAVASIDDDVALQDERLRIGVVQTNMGIYLKREDPGEGLRRHREQSLELQRQGAELIVWPESGFNYAISSRMRNVAREVLGPIERPVLFGGLREERNNRARKLYNAAFLIDGTGDILGTYDKTYLLAFGEYLPLGDVFPWLYELSPNTSRFTRGAHTDPLVLDGVRFGVLICYEDILPGFVRRVMASEPHVLVNMTNDAWYGRSREPLIHLALSTFRAVEHRRWLVRATNTGISAFVDPAGRLVQQTPIFARANLLQEVTPLQGLTVYALWGDWVAWLCLVVLVIWTRRPLAQRTRALLFARMRRKRH